MYTYMCVYVSFGVYTHMYICRYIHIYIATGRNLEYHGFFQKFLTQNLEYGPNGASVCTLRISPQALSYSFWLRRCSKIRPNFLFSLLWHFFINVPDFLDSARIWFSRCCGTFSSIFPSLFDLPMHDEFWHSVKISINHQTTKTFQTMFCHVLITRKMKKVPVEAILMHIHGKLSRLA